MAAAVAAVGRASNTGWLKSEEISGSIIDPVQEEAMVAVEVKVKGVVGVIILVEAL